MIKLPLPDMEYLPKKVKYDNKSDTCKVEFELKKDGVIKAYTFQANTPPPPELRNSLVELGECLNDIVFKQPEEGFFSLEQLSFNFGNSTYYQPELNTSVLDSVIISFSGIMGKSHSFTWEKSDKDIRVEMLRRDCDYEDVFPTADKDVLYECEMKYSGFEISHYSPAYSQLSSCVSRIIEHVYGYSMLGITSKPTLFDEQKQVA